MISKKYIILSIFLLSLLTLSVVSAADNATNDVISLEESNDSISVEETQAIQQNDNNEVLSSNEGTFDDLQTIIDAADENSTILLENNYKYNDGFDNNGINIAKNLTIDGGGHTIDGDKKGRIFNVLNDNFVIFKNIIFVKGHTDKEGGAIYGKGTAMNCTFNNNDAEKEHGGAIAYVNAINCTFNDNEAIMGGAIYNGDATDCIFNHNNAVSGGAAYSDDIQHTVKNCTFYNNIGYEGGAVCCIQQTYRVIDSYFKENEARCGGAIYDADATNCIFIKNVVKETYDYDDGKGGALCEGHAYNCTFDSNYARDKGDGGALAYAYAENCIFKSNHAVDLGGAIYETDAVNCTFTENYANNAGGAMYYGKATNCIFEKNKLDGDGKNGGAIYQGDAKNCTFIGNSAHHGGAMNCEDDTQAYTAEGCTFIGNSADGGGAVYYAKAVNCTFTGNHAKSSGGAMHTGNAVNCNFTDNQADDDGGAIFKGGAINCTFIGNKADDHGGAIHHGDGKFTAVNCTFNNNSADGGGATFGIDVVNCIFTNSTSTCDGGAVYYGDAENCTFTGNTAERDGGSIFKGDAINCTFIDNSAKDTGGAIFKGNANNCTFIGNSAQRHGGAMQGGTDEGLKAVYCTFIGNSAGEYGGAVFLEINVFNCIFINNTASAGGAVYDGHAHYCTFSGNTAGSDGGAMCYGIAVNCTFIGNTATNNGGAKWKGGAQNCTFTNNSAAVDGGAVFIHSDEFASETEYTNCNFIGNSAGNRGGAIFCHCTVESELKVHDCTFIGNSAEDGGAIYEETSMCAYNMNCYFIKNKASCDGGAVYNSDVDNGTFISNVAGCNGSAIYKGTSLLSYFEDNDVYETTIYNYDLHVDDVSDINQGEKLKVILKDNTEALGYDIAVDVYEITESKEILKDTYHVLSGDSFIINYTNGLYKFKCSLNRSGVISHDREIKVHGKLSICATDGDIYVPYMDEDCYTITYKDGFGNPVNGLEFSADIRGNKNYTQNYTTDENGQIKIYFSELNPDTYMADIYLVDTEKYEADNVTREVYVSKGLIKMDATTLVTTYNSGEEFIITLNNIRNNPIANFSVSIDFKGTKNYTTDENGQINLSLMGLSPDTYDIEATFNENDFYENSTAYAKVVINKDISSLTTNTLVTVYNSSDELVITLKDSNNNPIANVTVSVDLDGTKKHTTDENGQIIISTKGLTPKTYNVTATFKGNENYKGSDIATEVIINKITTQLHADALTKDYVIAKEFLLVVRDENGNPIANTSVSIDLNGIKAYITDDNGQIKSYIYEDLITIILTDDSGNPLENATLSVDLNGAKNYRTDENGQIKVPTASFKPGIYPVNVYFGGDKYHYESNTTAKLTVNKCSSNLTANSVETTYNEPNDLIINLKDNLGYPIIGAQVCVDIDGVKNYTTDKNGQINIPTHKLAPDNYIAKISFGGDEYCLESSAQTFVVVEKATSKLTANSVETTYGDNKDLVITLTDGDNHPIANATVTVNLNGNKNYTTDKNGQIKIPTANLTPNNYTVKIKYGENDYREGSSIETMVLIAKSASKLTANSVETTYGENKDLIITLTDGDNHPITNATVTVNLNGNKNYKTDKNGQIKIPTGNITPNNYTVKIKYGENDYHEGSSIETMVLIAKSASKLTANSVETTYGENKDLIITLTDGDNHPITNATVTVNLNGNKNYKTDKNGQITIPTGNITPNNYIAKISFEDEYYIASTIETAVVVNKITTKLTANNVTTTYNVNENLIISLKDSEGNPIQNISVSVDLGSVKNYVTDEKGQINIPVQKLVPKTYVAKIKFKGNSHYIESETADVVVVKKATPKIGAKAKTFKVKTKTKKYAITLKNNKKQALKNTKVYLKVKGKTYAAKTNSKGKATFKITKLTKKGKFTAAVTYNGNKYYKKVTKKTKIIIK